MVTELALEAADEKRSGVVMAVPSCRAGIAGTGGMPSAKGLGRSARGLRDGSEALREWPGCSLWMDSVSLVGRLDLAALAEGRT
jgi:hypothetical protein